MRNTDKLFIMWEKEDDENFRAFFKTICGKDLETTLINLKGTHFLEGVLGLNDIHEKILRLSGYNLKVTINRFPKEWKMKYEHVMTGIVKKFKLLPLEDRMGTVYKVKGFSIFPLKSGGFYQFTNEGWTRLK